MIRDGGDPPAASGGADVYQGTREEVDLARSTVRNAPSSTQTPWREVGGKGGAGVPARARPHPHPAACGGGRHAGAARRAHNWALGRIKAVLDQRTAECSYGLADDPLTPTIGWTLPALRKAWNQAKDDVAPWWREVSKDAFNTGVDALARGLKNWNDSRTGVRADQRIGFPHFKAKHRTTPSVRFTTGTIRVAPDRRRVVLPRLGRLKLHESARKLAGRIEAGTARIMSATVRREGRRWFVEFTVEIERTVHQPVRPESVVRVDVGIKHLAVSARGEPAAPAGPLGRGRGGRSAGRCPPARPRPAYRSQALPAVEAGQRSPGRVHTRVADVHTRVADGRQ
jgi:putative transposase